MNTDHPTPHNASDNSSSSLNRTSWAVILLGLVITTLGFILMAGGASEDPETFNPEVFSARRITVAPILVLIGFVTGIAGILWRSSRKSS
ncbi:MAG: DUF3098 domain-containing protein [Flavobacteriales bacterium]|nr:DUF3098 domain-containing protein [Flavobacteriales bacterium]MCX7649655.1 DUF3098 domain-containing protein [Flavobacteriales bacterium]MDW8432164.1 DUF3098 domain-containing protein [Flavobacteriales bacterium]